MSPSGPRESFVQQQNLPTTPNSWERRHLAGVILSAQTQMQEAKLAGKMPALPGASDFHESLGTTRIFRPTAEPTHHAQLLGAPASCRRDPGRSNANARSETSRQDAGAPRRQRLPGVPRDHANLSSNSRTYPTTPNSWERRHLAGVILSAQTQMQEAQL